MTVGEVRAGVGQVTVSVCWFSVNHSSFQIGHSVLHTVDLAEYKWSGIYIPTADHFLHSFSFCYNNGQEFRQENGSTLKIITLPKLLWLEMLEIRKIYV